MVGTSKCGLCINKDQCEIRLKLNNLMQEAITMVEAEVKRQAPGEIDYMIVTDISVIPTRCQHFRCREGDLEVNRKRERLFFFGNEIAPSAV
ncbi:hypothetical protein JCM14036_19760 [Desulfotomaculum defluvii]